MKNIVMLGSLLALIGCGAAPTSSEETGTTEEALNPAKISAWQTIPRGNMAGDFWGTPAIYSYFGSLTSRWWNVCATTTVQTMVCNYRQIIGSDSGWQGWGVVTPPAGVTFGASGSSPAMTQWTDNQGLSWGGLAARQHSGPTPNSIYLRITRHAQPSTWYLVPNSGNASGFGATNFSLVYSAGYLYIVASKCSGSTCTAHFMRNYVATGYVNTNWSAWTQDTAGGVFKSPVIANAFAPNGSLIVSGRGTDNAAWVSRIFGSSWEGGWLQVGYPGVFNDSPSATTFSQTASDVQLFGLGTDNRPWQGSLNAARTVFDGWYQFGPLFFRSPASYAPAANVISLAAWGTDIDTNPIFVADYIGP